MQSAWVSGFPNKDLEERDEIEMISPSVALIIIQKAREKGLDWKDAQPAFLHEFDVKCHEKLTKLLAQDYRYC